MSLVLREAKWGDEAVATLVDRALEDLVHRYLESDGADDPAPGAWDEALLPPAPTAAPVGDSSWEIDALTVVRPRGVLLVAELEGEPVGCGALRPLPGGDPTIAEVKRMFVRSEARGRGVARAILQRLVAVAGESGYRQVVLETGTRQPEAMGLYESAGWMPITRYGEYRNEDLARCYHLDL